MNIDKVIDTLGANTMESALELLNLLGVSSVNQHNAPRIDMSYASTSCEKKDIETSTKLKSRSLVNCTYPSLAEQNLICQDKRPIKPLFLSEGITEQLKCLVNGVKEKSLSDYLFLLVHSIIEETGLTLKVIYFLFVFSVSIASLSYYFSLSLSPFYKTTLTFGCQLIDFQRKTEG